MHSESDSGQRGGTRRGNLLDGLGRADLAAVAAIFALPQAGARPVAQPAVALGGPDGRAAVLHV